MAVWFGQKYPAVQTRGSYLPWGVQNRDAKRVIEHEGVLGQSDGHVLLSFGSINGQ
jgi:hypothetical protein